MKKTGYDKEFKLFDKKTALSHHIYTIEIPGGNYQGFCPACGKKIIVNEKLKEVKCNSCQWIGVFEMDEMKRTEIIERIIKKEKKEEEEIPITIQIGAFKQPKEKGKMKKESLILKTALEYQKRDWSIIPITIEKKTDIKKGKVEYQKRPLIAWQKYQRERATQKQVKEWWEKYPKAGIGLVTGEISGVIVLDVDSKAGEDYLKIVKIPLTPCVKTFRGRHIYFNHPGYTVRNFAKKADLDLRGDGGFVVLPPTRDPRGGKYQWTPDLSLQDTGISDPPDWLLKLIMQERAGEKLKESELTILLKGVKQGKRHDTATRLAGYFLGKRLEPGVVLIQLQDWNKKNNPPLPEIEIKRIIKDFAKPEPEPREQKEIKEIIAQGISYDKAKDLIIKPEKFWIDKGLIPEKSFILFAGLTYLGKTTLTLQMILRLLQGDCQFLSFFEIKKSPKILYIFAEGTKEDIIKTLDLQTRGMEFDLTTSQKKNLTIQPRQRTEMQTAKGRKTLKSLIQSYNPDICIFDPVHRFTGSDDLNKMSLVNMLFDYLLEIKEKCSWFLISHFRKPSPKDIKEKLYKTIGSSAFANNSDTFIGIERADPHRSSLFIELNFELRKGKPLEPINLKFNEEYRILERIERKEILAGGVNTQDIYKLLKKEFNGKSRYTPLTELASDKFRVSQARIRELLRDAREEGLILKEKGREGKYIAL